MKALSLWEPHLLAIELGLKVWETRDWPTRHRGPLALQAARRRWQDVGPWHTAALRKLRRKLFPSMADALSDSASFALVAPHLHYGCVTCVADVTDCVRTSELRGHIGEAEFWGDFSDGDTGQGRYAHRLENVRVLDLPLSVIGKQGYFDVDLGAGWGAASGTLPLFGERA